MGEGGGSFEDSTVPLVEVHGTLIFKSEVDENKFGAAMLCVILNTRQIFEYRMKCKLNKLNLLSTLFEKGVLNRVLWLSPNENTFWFHVEPSVEWSPKGFFLDTE